MAEEHVGYRVWREAQFRKSIRYQGLVLYHDHIATAHQCHRRTDAGITVVSLMQDINRVAGNRLLGRYKHQKCGENTGETNKRREYRIGHDEIAL